MTFSRLTQRFNELTVLVTPRPLPAKRAGLTMGPEIASQVSWRPANEVPRYPTTLQTPPSSNRNILGERRTYLGKYHDPALRSPNLPSAGPLQPS